MIKVIGPKDTAPAGAVIVNTTSRSQEAWTQGLSPFNLGPLKLYGNYVSQNMENAWQFAKVYPEHVDQNNEPTDAYLLWAMKGWGDRRAYRYPAGKGRAPLYSLWDGQKLSYVEARKKIYIPLYSEAVRYTAAYKRLSDIAQINDTIYLWDFDGYNHRAMGMSYQDVMDCDKLKMGHAFVLAMMLDGFI